MKIFLFAVMLFALPLVAQTPAPRTSSLPGAASTSGATGATGTKPATTTTTPAVPAKEDEGIKAPAKETASTEINYLSPGVLIYQGSQWIGGDNLLNLSHKINIKVELVLPSGKKSPIQESEVKKHLQDIFKKVEIVDLTEAFKDKPPLPFFHVLIMIQSIEKGFSAYIGGRLFEDVTVPRVLLNDNTFFQAITWEKQDVIVASPEEISSEILKVVDDIGATFIDRYKFYENIKSQLK